MKRLFCRLEKWLFIAAAVYTIGKTIDWPIIPFGLYLLLGCWILAHVIYRISRKYAGPRNATILVASLIGGSLLMIYAQSIAALWRYYERERAYPSAIVSLGNNESPSVFFKPYLSCVGTCLDLLIDHKSPFIETKNGEEGGIARWMLVQDKARCWSQPKSPRPNFLEGIDLWLLGQGACIVSEKVPDSQAHFYYENDRIIDTEAEKLSVERISAATPGEDMTPISRNVHQSVEVRSFPPDYKPTVRGYGFIAYGSPWTFRTSLWQTDTWLDMEAFLNQTLGTSLKKRLYRNSFDRDLLGDHVLPTIVEAAQSEREDLQQSVALLMCTLEKQPDRYAKTLAALRAKHFKCTVPLH